MDITKAKKVVELEKDGRKILVTLWEGDQISSCVTGEDNRKQYCETCQGNEELCNEWLNHLKEKGYEATEFELGELELEESLPKFFEERESTIRPTAVVAPEVSEDAISPADQALS